MGVIMATELTVKERAFAELVVRGSKTAAYRTVYSAKGSPATQATNAYKLSRKPKIKIEVARLLQQRAFPADDYKRLQETAIAGLMEIFLHDADSRVRLKAGSLLLAFADAGLKLHPEPSEKERAFDEITQHIEDAARNQRETMERESEQALMVEPAEEEAEPLVEVAVEDEPACGEAEAPKPDETATVEVSLVADPLKPAPQFRMERVPGYFPAKYRRVPIEP
jgi:hypothetical protein